MMCQYVRIYSVADETGEYDLLIVGGEDHKTGQANGGTQRHARLEAWARERFPMMEDVAFRWSGQVMEPVDGVAFIGRKHLGCVVSWNSLEKSWDCSCHGSRYDHYGKVINGPANQDLPKMEE